VGRSRAFLFFCFIFVWHTFCLVIYLSFFFLLLVVVTTARVLLGAVWLWSRVWLGGWGPLGVWVALWSSVGVRGVEVWVLSFCGCTCE